MNDHTAASATSGTSNKAEATFDGVGVKKSQVGRMSKLPVQIGKTGVRRQPLRSQHVGDQGYVSASAENCVHLENSKDKENKQGQMAKSQEIQPGYIRCSSV